MIQNNNQSRPGENQQRPDINQSRSGSSAQQKHGNRPRSGANQQPRTVNNRTSRPFHGQNRVHGQNRQDNQPHIFVSNILKNSGMLFFCKDCEKVVDVIPIGKKFVYKCALCGTKNVAFGTEKSINNFFRIENAAIAEVVTSQTPESGLAKPPDANQTVVPANNSELKQIPNEGN